MKFRRDVFFSLIAIESILIAIATIFCFPWWVAIIAGAMFVGSVIGLILSIRRLRKKNYDEENGKTTYRFPWTQVSVDAILLTLLTTMMVLIIKQLFGFALLAFAGVVVLALVVASRKNWSVVGLIAEIILAVIVVFFLAHGVAYLVHNGVVLNPGFVDAPVDTEQPDTQAPDTQEPDTQAPDTQEPDTQAPDTQAPDTQEPDTQAPDTQAPDTQEPDTQEPDTQEPDTQEPDTQAPEVTANIIAPETLTYGVPVSIKLEGIDADDLKYGNKEFISIVKVSDSEVVITLVGIVNDAGQVEIVPASGYITVTDAVTGTNVSIRIVE